MRGLGSLAKKRTLKYATSRMNISLKCQKVKVVIFTHGIFVSITRLGYNLDVRTKEILAIANDVDGRIFTLSLCKFVAAEY